MNVVHDDTDTFIQEDAKDSNYHFIVISVHFV